MKLGGLNQRRSFRGQDGSNDAAKFTLLKKMPLPYDCEVILQKEKQIDLKSRDFIKL